jgi:Zn-dependent M32 family carboxypeptidase
VTVPDDKNGAFKIFTGAMNFGYFATYSLGSMYAAQLYAAIERGKPVPGKGNKRRG